MYGLVRCLLSHSTSAPDARSTSAVARPARSYGNESPANTPMPMLARRASRRAGTPVSRHSAPKDVSTTEAVPIPVGVIVG